MPDSTKKSARQPTSILNEARSLLSSVTLIGNPKPQSRVSSSEKEPSESSGGLPLQQQQQNASVKNTERGLLLQCISLMEEFHRLSSADFQFEFKDWTVVKAVAELLVRWGIYPFLSRGVGIPLQKRFGEKAVAAAAAALSGNLLHDASTVEPSGFVSSDSIDGAVETHPLVLSAELLSAILLEGPEMKHEGNGSGMADDQPKAVDKEEKVDGSRSGNEEDDPGFSSPAMALHQLVLSHHVVDVLAALLQAAYGASLTSTSMQASEMWKKNAVQNIKILVEGLPAAYLVEALFILLGEAEGLQPPLWFKPEVGKLLSMAVMHDGGVAAVMERLVGRAEKGSVHVYERVAAQLARVPRSVASKDQYYKRVCMQLQLLLVLPQTHSKFGSSSDLASRLVSNMHHTSILLACSLANQDPALVDRYLTLPIVEPLLSSDAFRSQSEMVKSGASTISERVVVDSLLEVQALITAGHKGSAHLRQQLLKATFLIAPKLILVNYLLSPFYPKHDGRELEGTIRGLSNNQVESHTERQNGPRKDFPSGFLINKSVSTSSGSGADVGGPVGNFASSVSDIVQAHLSQRPTSQALSIVSAFLFSLDTPLLDWPTVDGEISDALKAGREQPDSPVVFIAKLLLRSESWELAIGLLGAVLKNILRLRQTTQSRSTTSGFSQSSADIVTPETVLQSLQTLDTLYVEVGLKAVEQDASTALPLLKTLLDDSDLLAEVEILDLVLLLVHSAVSRLQGGGIHKDEERNVVPKENQKEAVMESIRVSLAEIQQSPVVPPKQNEFAGAIRSMICDILQH